MDEDRLIRARSALGAIESPPPELGRVKRIARRRRVRNGVAGSLATIVLAAGVLLPILGLRSLGGGETVVASGPSGPVATGATGPAPTGPAPTGPVGERLAPYLPPYLGEGEGWFVYQSSLARPDEPTFAWASSVPIVESDLTHGAVIPPETIRTLPAEGVVITVETVTSVFDPSLGPFPYDLSNLRLAAAAVRSPEAEEPTGDYGVIEIDDPAALVRVYFGTASPSDALIDAAQQELNTLQLPPTCPFPGPGGYAIQPSVTHGAPGDAVTISGLMPFQHKDGSFNSSGDTMMVAWWNASSDDYPYLLQGSRVAPSPVVDGSPLLRLGQDGGNVCAFAIGFTVPEAPPGDYPIVVVQEVPSGGTTEGAFVFHVDPAD